MEHSTAVRGKRRNKQEGRQLSANLLQMKFMQRSRRRLEDEETKESSDRLKKSYLTPVATRTAKVDTQLQQYHPSPAVDVASTSGLDSDAANDASTDENRAAIVFVYQNSYAVLENLLFGRLSFQQCNPEIEKLMLYYGGKGDPDAEELEKEIGDTEMAERLNADSNADSRTAMSDTMAKKLQPKRRRDHQSPSRNDDDERPTTKKRFRKPQDD